MKPLSTVRQPPAPAGPLARRRVTVALVLLLLLAALLRFTFPLADPPWKGTVGVVWHDEGAWTHNARNQALFGAWRLDEWNPMYVAPVFTALEYGSFAAFGVGLWQARLVPEALGLLSVLLLCLGIRRLGGDLAGLVAGALLGTNFVYLMYNRAALMEAPMVAFVVLAWYAYVRATDSPRWGLVAGAAAACAYFTKASAVFFVAALGLDALLTIALARWQPRDPESERAPEPGAWFTLAGLAGSGLVALATFVLPNWAEYRFYNWQMSVTRKPSYTIKAFADRISWFPIVHDFFTRAWLVTVFAVGALLGLISRWRRVMPGERLLGLWIILGAAELILHDVGNERRLVFFVPAMVGLAALAIGRDRRLLNLEHVTSSRWTALALLPVVAGSLYLVLGSLIRLHALYQVRPGVLWSAGAAFLGAVIIHATWPRIPRALSWQWGPRGAVVVTAIILAADLGQYAFWAATRSYKNYHAMVEVGRVLPPGTLVHGKLANGLALENGIKPVFVGRGFGNYADRATRTDIRYLATYIRPSLGFESQRRNPVIGEILAVCPGWKIIHEFDVAETSGGDDRAVLIDKYPER